MKIPRNRWIALAVLAVVAADWLTKFLVQNHIRLYGHRTVIDGWFWLAHRENRGISFSFLDGMPDAVRIPLLAAAAGVGIAVALRIYVKTHDALVRIAAGLVIAGAVGNLGDRLMNGAVTDFFLVRYFPFVFNVADIAITTGAILLAARMVLAEPHPGGPATPASSEA